MKGLVIVLTTCVIGLAQGQGRSITQTIGGQVQGQANQLFNPLNVITNPLDRTCGQWKGVCFGQGLNNRGVTPVNALVAQCHARVAQNHGFLLRIDRFGGMFLTNKFGQNIEDIEFEVPQQQLGFGGQFGGQQQFNQAGQPLGFNSQFDHLINAQLKADAAMRELEFRCQIN